MKLVKELNHEKEETNKCIERRKMEFPDEIWKIVKDYQIDYKKHHSIQMSYSLEKINDLYSEIYERWILFPPYSNTSDIIRAEYPDWYTSWAPRPNLPLVSITYNATGNHGWRAGYGWGKKENIV